MTVRRQRLCFGLPPTLPGPHLGAHPSSPWVSQIGRGVRGMGVDISAGSPQDHNLAACLDSSPVIEQALKLRQ